MRKMTMPNFCINFLNKAAKSLSILYDFAVASLADAWIKMLSASLPHLLHAVASLADAWIKMEQQKVYLNNTKVRIPLPQRSRQGLAPL